MNASIIIPTINARPDLLATCVAEVQRTMREGDQLLVVEDDTFAGNCNAGAALAENDYLIFLNDDCKPDQDDWIDRLLQPFAEPKVGIVGCRLIYPTGMIQHAGVNLFVDQAGHLHGQNRTWDCESGPVVAVTGACMAIRSSVFAEQGGFFEGYRNGNEDVDLCLRVTEAGHIVWYTADCTVIHHESQSGPARWIHVQENVALLNERWSVAPETA